MKKSQFCIIEEGAVLGENITLGNFCTIETGVVIGNNCQIGNCVTIKTGVVIGDNCIIHENCVFRGNTTIGDNNEFLPNSVIGFWPKDIGDHHYEGRLEIGDNNFFGEGTIINVGEATELGDLTKLGSSIYSMDKVTINHNDLVAIDEEIPLNPKRTFTTIISSGVSLAGHVEVGVGANLGMQATAHQFVKIGAGAMIGMNADVAKNVIPFGLVIGHHVVGYNKRPLAENLEFGIYEDNVLSMVAEAVKSSTLYGDVSKAQASISHFMGGGYWNDRAVAVIQKFLDSNQNGRKIMKWREK